MWKPLSSLEKIEPVSQDYIKKTLSFEFRRKLDELKKNEGRDEEFDFQQNQKWTYFLGKKMNNHTSEWNGRNGQSYQNDSELNCRYNFHKSREDLEQFIFKLDANDDIAVILVTERFHGKKKQTNQQMVPHKNNTSSSVLITSNDPLLVPHVFSDTLEEGRKQDETFYVDNLLSTDMSTELSTFVQGGELSLPQAATKKRKTTLQYQANLIDTNNNNNHYQRNEHWEHLGRIASLKRHTFSHQIDYGDIPFIICQVRAKGPITQDMRLAVSSNNTGFAIGVGKGKSNTFGIPLEEISDGDERLILAAVRIDHKSSWQQDFWIPSKYYAYATTVLGSVAGVCSLVLMVAVVLAVMSQAPMKPVSGAPDALDQKSTGLDLLKYEEFYGRHEYYFKDNKMMVTEFEHSTDFDHTRIHDMNIRTLEKDSRLLLLVLTTYSRKPVPVYTITQYDTRWYQACVTIKSESWCSFANDRDTAKIQAAEKALESKWKFKLTLDVFSAFYPTLWKKTFHLAVVRYLKHYIS